MSIAIGGWILMLVSGMVKPTMPLNVIINTGSIVHGFDSAAECEEYKTERLKETPEKGYVCVPALATINR